LNLSKFALFISVHCGQKAQCCLIWPTPQLELFRKNIIVFT